MPNTTTNRAPMTARIRTRAAAVVTAGLCASVALTGAAVAAEGNHTDVFAANTATSVADAVRGQADALNAAADAAKKNADAWVSPIADDYSLSATFGNSGDRWASTHSGQDFAVPTGTEVQAVHAGTVVKAGGNGAGDGPAYGNAIVIKHSDGTFTQYAHLSEVDVKVGQKVSTGDKIALSGNTGNSSGPHLHFEVRTTANYGSAIDPMKFLRDHDADV
ncbi:M23 family metallopeptidase [Streptomyces litchfieldiae]|uniref:M23 family metallopeptidase n=1 Tax=Streptomyces litchfieldiae TaxID=3075543 RepID=A0ABU2MT66_9ACTN|nr:M23 family metallopeptidase [Streptomyces sp. DSM 44938]MDT0344725.1 M23 family metallopeptidase [Streptomyces sp. DSM 44938]